MVNAELMTQIGMLAVAFILPIIGIGSYTDWYIFKLFKVKSSGGKRVMIRKRLPTGNRYYVANIDDKDAIWNEKAGLLGKDDKGRITIPPKAIHTELGCKLIECDSEGRLYCPDGTIVSGFDPKHLQDLLNREAEKPAEDNAGEKVKLILMLITLLLSGICVYLTFKNSQKLDALIVAYDGLKQVLINTTVHNIA